MQTQCPHCKSRYRLSPEMIEAYGGFVRCGNCDYKFNVHDQVRLDHDYFELLDENAVQEDYAEDSPGFRRESGVADRIEPRLDRPEEDELNIRFRADAYEFEEDRPDMPAKKIEPRFEFPSLGESQDHDSATGSIPEVTSEEADKGLLESDQPDTDSHIKEAQVEEPQVEETQVEEPQVEETQVEETQVEEAQAKDIENQATEAFYSPFDDRESNEPDEGLPEASSQSGQSVAQAAQDQTDERTPDFNDFNFGENFEVEDDDQRIEPSFSSQRLINDEAEEDGSGSGAFQHFVAALGRLISFVFWLIAAIALTYLLLGQIKDRVYPAYKNTPLVQDIRDGVCGFMPCVDAKYDIEQYEIVVSRMDEINAEGRQLLISVFLLNKAQHAQEYPNILITLKRMDGSTTGRRVITPDEYITSHNSLISTAEGNGSNVTKALIKPNKLGKILVQFDKPPTDAVGFEARVVP